MIEQISFPAVRKLVSSPHLHNMIAKCAIGFSSAKIDQVQPLFFSRHRDEKELGFEACPKKAHEHPMDLPKTIRFHPRRYHGRRHPA
jgi:hypothetical protein